MALVTANQFQLQPNTAGAISSGLQLGGQIKQQFITDPQIEQLRQKAAAGDPQALTQLSGIAPAEAQKVQQFQLGQQQSQAFEQEQRFKSVVQGALEVQSIQDPAKKLAFMKNRRSELQANRLPTNDTDEVIARFEAGDIAGGSALIDRAVNIGIQQGIIKAPTTRKLSSLQQKVEAEGLDPFTPEGQARAREITQGSRTDPSLKPSDQAVLNKANEGQLASSVFANRVGSANDVLAELEATADFDPTSLQTAFFEAIPGGNIALSDNEQRFSQAKRDFITAVLRKESGAAIGKDEFINEDKKFFPQVGDKPAVLKQKALGRKRAFDNLKAQSKGVFDVQFGGKSGALSKAEQTELQQLRAELGQ